MRILNSRKYREALSYILNASRRHRLSLFRAFLEFLNVSLRKKFSPFEIYSMDLLNPNLTSEDITELVSKEVHLKNQIKLNPAPYRLLTEDKVLFHYYCRGAGLPVPSLLAVMNRNGLSYNPDKGRIASYQDFERIIQDHGTDIICKPVYNAHGDGILGFDLRDQKYVCIGANYRSLEAFYDYLQDDGTTQEFIIQEKLYSHDDIAEISEKKMLQGLRLITVTDEKNCPHLIIRKLKFAGTSPLLDNFSLGKMGSMHAMLDENGKVEKAVTYSHEQQSLICTTHHKFSKRNLVGFQVPFWNEAVDLVLKAQQHFLPLRTIGWDVAITNNGPVLIEGNVFWDPLSLPEGPMKSLSRKYNIG